MGSSANKTQAPDVLGEDGRAQIVLNMLRNIQSQLTSLEVEAAANGLGDDDRAPAVPDKTVGEHRDHLQSAEKRLVEQYADVMPAVRRISGQ